MPKNRQEKLRNIKKKKKQFTRETFKKAEKRYYDETRFLLRRCKFDM